MSEEFDVAMTISLDPNNTFRDIPLDPREWNKITLEQAIRLRYAYIERVIDVQPKPTEVPLAE